MIELGVIIALVGLIGWQEYQNRKERNKLMNALMSKNTQDFKELELAERTNIKIKPDNDIPDLIPTDQLSDEDWEKVEIKGEKIKWPIN
jgi:negative regulator of sigma E activity